MARLIVALDLPTRDAALDMVDRLGESVDHYKVGSPLFTAAGPEIVEALLDHGKQVFLDLKFHDIPNTVARAVEAAAAMGVSMMTLHASGGAAMMQAAREARDAMGDDDAPRLLGVTLLTSFTAADVENVWGKELRSLREEVIRLAGLAAESGMDGVVASGLEAEPLKRKHGNGFIVVTPGIRPSGEKEGDQARTASPAKAALTGADFLVVGRPIIQAGDPAAAAEKILAEIEAPPGKRA